MCACALLPHGPCRKPSLQQLDPDVQVEQRQPLVARRGVLLPTAHGLPIILGRWTLRQALLQKHFLVSSRIPVDHPEDLIPQPLVEVRSLKAVRIENG